ncbi:MAG TPA: oxidoreductase [Catalimonadaceae bacterium]|nr:oxidoreductase [Catalimonadaceae bacterium]
MKVWFITGVSGGLGRSLALEAARQGDVVVGTLRNPDQFAGFENLFPGKTFPVLADVTNFQQVEAGIDYTISRFGRLDVLVNNAGYGLMGAVEELSEDQIRHQMEVNFFGALNAIRCALPHMRKQRNGHILNISSIAGLNGTNGGALYNASKFALEGLSEGLTLEVKPLGIAVTIVEPGPFRTKWAGEGLVNAEKSIPDYHESAHLIHERLANINGKQAGDPDKAAKLMWKITRVENPPLRLLLGASAYNLIERKMQKKMDEFAEWKSEGKATDFE